MQDLFYLLIDFLGHLNQPEHLAGLVGRYGTLLYLLLFLIILAETGLVVMPLLPGDSLLFAVGALAAATGNELNVWTVIPLLIVAALTGDQINYFAGRSFGQLLRNRERLFLFRREYLLRTERFYARHGGKTVILARFVPIVRTLAPFVAGAGAMSYGRYVVFCVIGAVSWVGGLTLLGYAFGNLPVVRDHFEVVVIGIVLLSLAPVGAQFLRRGAGAGQIG